MIEKRNEVNYITTLNQNFNATPNKLQVEILQVAQQYHELGLTPLPLQPHSKQPVAVTINGEKWTWGSWQNRRPAWNEVETVFRHAIAEFGENINIGLFCGKLHGNLLVLDADDPPKFKQACNAIGLKMPKTPVVRTRKGVHYYFRYPDGYSISRIERLND